jgi:hypothetical protein
VELLERLARAIKMTNGVWFTVWTYINVIINCFWNACNNHLQTSLHTFLQFNNDPNISSATKTGSIISWHEVLYLRWLRQLSLHLLKGRWLQPGPGYNCALAGIKHGEIMTSACQHPELQSSLP